MANLLLPQRHGCYLWSPSGPQRHLSWRVLVASIIFGTLFLQPNYGFVIDGTAGLGWAKANAVTPREPGAGWFNPNACVLTLILIMAKPSNVDAISLAPASLSTAQCAINRCGNKLVRCFGDMNCVANLACIVSQGSSTLGQVRCGDMFESSAINNVNKCIVERERCIKPRIDMSVFPDVPTVVKFDPSKFTGVWYVSAGLNPAFDTSDCQIHEFSSPGPGTSWTTEPTHRA